VRRYLLATVVASLFVGHPSAWAASAGAPPSSLVPNYYELYGRGMHVIYSLANRGGTASLTYQDAHGALNFGPDQIRTQKTELGTLVTVTTVMTVDTGSTTFTLVVPDVNLGLKMSAPIQTRGVITVHHFSIVRTAGQVEDYSTIGLHGIAQAMMVPLG
jgi:hypothetical protein